MQPIPVPSVHMIGEADFAKRVRLGHAAADLSLQTLQRILSDVHAAPFDTSSACLQAP